MFARLKTKLKSNKVPLPEITIAVLEGVHPARRYLIARDEQRLYLQNLRHAAMRQARRIKTSKNKTKSVRTLMRLIKRIVDSSK